ncbi:type II toxin-antitoxin system VapB family antitoxin [Streptomyces sp. NPDC059095]|uniref:type II toxin-antitoxin system VapB family antitoxin n=1 Tax=Streptomyces sp. NPDC059095 TaxID=3346726 RepID=UPI00369F0FE4
MSATRITIDDEALTEAMRLSGIRAQSEMVNLALREYAARRHRPGPRPKYFQAARDWGDVRFWRLHAAEKDIS